MDRKQHKEALDLIEKAYWRMARCCESTHDWDRYLELIWQEERNHQRFKPDHVRNGLTRAQSVRLFAVQNIFHTFTSGRPGEAIFKPQAEDTFHVKPAIFGAFSIAKTRGPEIKAEFTVAEMDAWLKRIDYAELNKDPRLWKAAA